MKPTLLPKPDVAPAGGFERVEVSLNSTTHLFVPAKVASYLLPSALELATDPGRWLLAGMPYALTMHWDCIWQSFLLQISAAGASCT